MSSRVSTKNGRPSVVPPLCQAVVQWRLTEHVRLPGAHGAVVDLSAVLFYS